MVGALNFIYNYTPGYAAGANVHKRILKSTHW